MGIVEDVYRYRRICRGFHWHRGRSHVNGSVWWWLDLRRWHENLMGHLLWLRENLLGRLLNLWRLYQDLWCWLLNWWCSLCLPNCNRFYYYRRSTRNSHTQMLGRGLGDVDYSPLHKRPPVVHPNRNLSVVVPVGHNQKRPEGQGGMRGSEQIGIEDLPGSGRSSLKLGPIPRGDSFLPKDPVGRTLEGLGCHTLRGKQDGNKAGK